MKSGGGTFPNTWDKFFFAHEAISWGLPLSGKILRPARARPTGNSGNMNIEVVSGRKRDIERKREIYLSLPHPSALPRPRASCIAPVTTSLQARGREQQGPCL